MSGHEKLLAEHRERCAFVYARQSSPAQVIHHRTSTERQFDLVERATELGWSATQIELVAEDLGRSGKFSENREGFQRLAAAVSLGRVGAVFILEASRLARSSADWHRLLDIACLTRTLIIDESTVYDPRDPNDRLVLGMKGTMADFEPVWLRQRMDGGRWYMARKGELRHRVTVGYVYDGNRMVFDPDEEVHRAVALLFERFARASSCRDLVRDFNAHNLQFPSRYGEKIVWKRAGLRREHPGSHLQPDLRGRLCLWSPPQRDDPGKWRAAAAHRRTPHVGLAGHPSRRPSWLHLLGAVYDEPTATRGREARAIRKLSARRSFVALPVSQ